MAAFLTAMDTGYGAASRMPFPADFLTSRFRGFSEQLPGLKGRPCNLGQSYLCNLGQRKVRPVHDRPAAGKNAHVRASTPQRDTAGGMEGIEEGRNN